MAPRIPQDKNVARQQRLARIVNSLLGPNKEEENVNDKDTRTSEHRNHLVLRGVRRSRDRAGSEGSRVREHKSAPTASSAASLQEAELKSPQD
jgi:hypothetical protein